MKSSTLKYFAFVLFVVQIIAGLSIFFQLHKTFPSIGFLNNPLYSQIALLVSVCISFLLVVIIFLKPKPPVQVVSGAAAVPVQKETRESKKKTEIENKRLQELNEKKRAMVAEMTKNLHAQQNVENFANQALINISKQIDIFQGIFFVKSTQDGIFRKAGAYAYYREDDLPEFAEGVGLTGQVAANKKLLNIVNIPEKYITVLSGLGKSSPTNLIIFPILHNQQTIGIVEIASFVKFDQFMEQALNDFAGIIAPGLFEINKTKEPELKDTP